MGLRTRRLGQQVWVRQRYQSWSGPGLRVYWLPATVVARGRDGIDVRMVVGSFVKRVDPSDVRPRDSRKQGRDRPR